LAIFIIFEKDGYSIVDNPGLSVAVKPNILLIVIDALRADHLSCYGYRNLTTPFLDELAAEGVLFEWAFANSGYTLLSHASLFTGKVPSHHGLLRTRDRLTTQNMTIAEMLRIAGYHTYGLHPSSWLGPDHGLDRGFVSYLGSEDVSRRALAEYARKVLVQPWGVKKNEIYPFLCRMRGFLMALRQGRDSQASTKVCILNNWLRMHNKDRPFFVFLHFMETHQPYRSSNSYRKCFEPRKLSRTLLEEARSLNNVEASYEYIAGKRFVSDEEWKVLKAWYDAAILYVDSRIEEVVSHLKRLNVYDNTFVIVTSDHGEAFGENGLSQHFYSLYDNLLHVPLIIRFPSEISPNTRANGLVSHIDILPTIAGIAGVGQSVGVGGMDLLPIRDKYHEEIVAERVEEAEALQRMYPKEDFSHFLGHWQALRSRDYKYIRNLDTKTEYLFDLNSDPAETVNQLNPKSRVAELLREKLEYFLAQASPSGMSEEVELNDMITKRLEELGYL
jgi:arylsulfatase A-like enzyme